MGVAEKLTTIAENQQKVYDAGYAKGQAEGGDDGFWDALQNYGNRKNYQYAFQEASFGDKFLPKYPIKFVDGNHIYCFLDAVIDRLDTTVLDTSEVTTFGASVFKGNIPYIELDLSASVTFSNTLSHNQSFKHVVLRNVTENCIIGEFRNCWGLEILTVTGTIGTSVNLRWSDRLAAESVANIVECLADLTGKDTQTLTLLATVGAKLTEEQKAAITAKNWTLVLY